MPVTGAQMQRPMVCEYALYPHRGDWQAADLYAAADAYLVPVQAASVEPGPDPILPPARRALVVDGAEVSSITRTSDGRRELRVFNPGTSPTTCSASEDDTPCTGVVVNLRGRTLRRFDGTADLRRGEILTVQLDG